MHLNSVHELPADNKSCKLRAAIFVVVPTSVLSVLIGSAFFRLRKRFKSKLIRSLMSVVEVVEHYHSWDFTEIFILSWILFSVFIFLKIRKTCLENCFPIRDLNFVLQQTFSKTHQKGSFTNSWKLFSLNIMCDTTDFVF